MGEPGDVIGGRYRVLGLLGSGGMADVMLADDLEQARRVALKRSRGGAASVRALAREARVMRRLAHPRVVALHGLVRDGGRDHLVLDHVAGTSLAEAPPPHAGALIAIARGLAEALAHVHARGVVHLDLKLENVVLGGDGVPVLIDFGIAWCEGEPETWPPAQLLVGTPRSMAPEQIRGHAIDGRADLFALGALLYELATDRSPFEAGSVVATVDQVLHHTPPPVASLAGGLPRRLTDLIDHLLEKDPVMRPQSGAEVIAHLG